MSEVVDLNQKRLDKELAKVPAGATPVTILECGTCKSVRFCLGIGGIVFCESCKIQIGALRWYDTNDVQPGPAP